MNVGKGWSEEKWTELVKRKPEKGSIIINTSKNNPKEVINIILKEIGEKPKKHPNIKSIRKSW